MKGFQEAYLGFLGTYEVHHDPRYLWDGACSEHEASLQDAEITLAGYPALRAGL